ncbi:maleylpyruvate isomerase family mycothiol-dependent enzyme [Streptomyces sp. NPDC005573]|uniref:maleylpyruvate isomerase family mycothiol-dependent enzyme n=1 Tax=Streptomyces sp. NPDC005573 TaxID=3156890 RepID=UPI00339E1373
MNTAEFLETLDLEGRLLADAAAEAGPDAKVPACPEWQVRDLLRHTGAVHRWASGFVAEGITEPRPIGDGPDLDGAELTDWYRESHRLLVETLSAASADTACWTVHRAPSPSPSAFWARRQAHETTVHRYDAEEARGGMPSPIAVEFAVDGIDELLRGFHARSRSRLRTEVPRVLRLRTTDPGTEAVWTVRLSTETPVTSRDATGEADAELCAPADLLYLALWNRAPLPRISGDDTLAELWREKGGIG